MGEILSAFYKDSKRYGTWVIPGSDEEIDLMPFGEAFGQLKDQGLDLGVSATQIADLQAALQEAASGVQRGERAKNFLLQLAQAVTEVTKFEVQPWRHHD